MTLYEVLGVSRGASAAELRAAYLRLARHHHPDVAAASADGAASGEERMRELNEAWAVLGDPARRRAYDRQLTAEASRVVRAPRGGASSSTMPTPSGGPSPDFVPLDDGDDPEDPAAEHDVPYGDGRPVHRGLQMAPVAALVTGVVALAAGSLLSFGPLVALGLVGLVGGVLGFVSVPVYAVLRSARLDEP